MRTPPRRAWSSVVDILAVAGVGTAFLVAALQLQVGRPTMPGPGLWPALISVILLLLALALTVGRTDGVGGMEPFTPDSWRPVAAVASLGVFVVLFAQVGFILAGTLILLGWLRTFGRTRWLRALMITAVAVSAVHLVIADLLHTPLPDDVVAELWTRE